MVRWGQGRVVPIARRHPVHHALGRAALATSKVGDASIRWRSSAIRRRLRDVHQLQWVEPPSSAELLYGHIVFPTDGRLPTLWSTNGVIDARPGMWFPEQSARTHARFIARAALTQCWS